MSALHAQDPRTMQVHRAAPSDSRPVARLEHGLVRAAMHAPPRARRSILEAARDEVGRLVEGTVQWSPSMRHRDRMDILEAVATLGPPPHSRLVPPPVWRQGPRAVEGHVATLLTATRHPMARRDLAGWGVHMARAAHGWPKACFSADLAAAIGVGAAEIAAWRADAVAAAGPREARWLTALDDDSLLHQFENDKVAAAAARCQYSLDPLVGGVAREIVARWPQSLQFINRELLAPDVHRAVGLRLTDLDIQLDVAAVEVKSGGFEPGRLARQLDAYRRRVDGPVLLFHPHHEAPAVSIHDPRDCHGSLRSLLDHLQCLRSAVTPQKRDDLAGRRAAGALRSPARDVS